jgi:alpha-beta hydrolase superfamily lysophospholipase
MRPSDQASWYDFAQELAEQGYVALTFDFRGYGESEGDKEFSKIDLDVEAAIRSDAPTWPRRRISYRREHGRHGVAVAAAREDVSGVVTLSAPASSEGLDAEEAVAQVTEPKLFFASKDDPSAKSSLEELFELAPEPKQQKVFNGDAHGTDMLTENEERAAELRRW